MIRKTFLALVIAVAALTACENESESISGDKDLKLVAFKPNQCSEPWDGEKYNTSGSMSRVDRMKDYLKDNGITQISKLEVTTDNMAYCAACTCPSSDNIKFFVSESDFTKIKTIAPFSDYLK